MTTLTLSCTSADCWSSLLDSTLYTGTTTAYVAGSTSDTDTTRVWIPFTVAIPKRTLTSATLRVVGAAAGNTGITFNVAASPEDSASDPATYAALAGKSQTTAKIVSATLPVSAGTEYSYDVTSIIQEILDRGGWVSGNNIGVMFVTTGPDSTKRCEIAMTEHATYAEPKLDLVFPGFIPKGSGLI
jgi:hypothetical protein